MFMFFGMLPIPMFLLIRKLHDSWRFNNQENLMIRVGFVPRSLARNLTFFTDSPLRPCKIYIQGI